MGIEELGKLSPVEQKRVEKLVSLGFPTFIIVVGIRMQRAGFWDVKLPDCAWPKDRKVLPPSKEYIEHSKKCLLCGTLLACWTTDTTSQYHQYARQLKWAFFKKMVRVMTRRIWRKIFRRSK